MYKPRLVITCGDPAGIGPEVVLKALSNPEFEHKADISVVGDRTLLHQSYQQLKAVLPADSLRHPDSLQLIGLDISAPIRSGVVRGQGNRDSGEISFRTLETAIAQTLSGHFDGIVTAPIAKSAWLAAGHAYPGQTELLAQMAHAQRFGMLFVARSPHSGWQLRTLLATTHIPLREVPQALSPAALTPKLALLIDCLQQDFGLSQGKIAIAGLNPHSGEQGQLGHEEQDWLIPWIQAQQARFPKFQLDGPIPPDTLWVTPGQAWYGLQSPAASALPHDAYLALYHDQGLIPVKLLAFDLAVNTTIGLPFVRTSPDHGTAFDIAGKGIARSHSTEAAISLAIELAQQRTQQGAKTADLK